MWSLRLLLVLSVTAFVLAAYGTGGSTANQNCPIVIAWLPSELGAELKDAREALSAVVGEVFGRPVEHCTTTT
ncbi:hypothetical protein [Chloroflexus sp.]|uniref:hypothetical protein n=1 Tax=Chloroflexus sp. TaxID=1904827 RepID=UPI003CA1E50E